MDLSTLDLAKAADQGAEMIVTHPITGEPLEDGTVGITLLGHDSHRFQKVRRELERRKLVTPKVKTSGMKESEVIEMAAGATVSWRGIKVDGKEVSCTREAAIEVYTRFAWVLEQVLQFMTERSNFLGNCVTASSSTPEE